MKHHITEFAAILAAYAAGQTVHWKHEGYRLAGSPEPGNIAVQYPANGHCCGLFHTDGVTSSYDPADFQIVPVSRPLAERITQGAMHAFPVAQYWMVGNAKTEPETKIVARMHTQTGNTEANAELIAEAFNVTHETGRTPRQLADERAELIASLSEAIAYIKAGCPEISDEDETIAISTDDGPEAVFHYSAACEILNSLNQ